MRQLYLSMDYNQFIVRQNRFSRKQFSESEHPTQKHLQRLDNNHRFSEPKARINLIKINKNKLPGDFFLKKDTVSRRNLNYRFHLSPEMQQSPPIHKKAQSERLHVSPEKTSFFGFFDEQEQSHNLKISGAAKLYNRKFQTREQNKRDAFPIESARKLNTATKSGKNQLLELFPSTYDEQITDIIISSSRTKNLKLSPRKENISKIRDAQPLIDPEKHTIEKLEKDIKKQSNTIKVNNVSMQEGGREIDSLNLTFFNAKSTCFPPINRPYNL